MKLLLNYLPGSGGEEVANRILEKNVKHSFRVDLNADVTRFKQLSEQDRFKIELVYGRLSHLVVDYVHHKMTRALLVSHPVDRIKRLHTKYASDNSAFLYPLCKAMSPEDVSTKVPDFQNTLAKTLNPDIYDVICTSPQAMLKLMGVPSFIKFDTYDTNSPGILAVNQQDTELWNWINSNAPNGFWLRNRKWHKSEVAVITTHFNPMMFKRQKETYYEWVSTINHPVLCYEMVLNDYEPEIEGSIVVRGDDSNIMWQKERLINLALQSLPANIRYVTWCDHDMVFQEPDWIAKGVNAIRNGYKAIQLFERIEYQDLNGEIVETGQSAASVLAKNMNPQGNPGGCWMADRKWLDSIGGVYDLNIMGGGDATFFHAISGSMTWYLSRQSPRLQNHIHNWVNSVGKVRMGYLSTTIRHLWHGDRADRQYISRDQTMTDFRYDPELHVEIGKNGLLQWTSAASAEMREAVKQFFKGRKEDF